MISSTDVPTYSEFMLPVLRAVEALGGSAASSEVIDQVLVMEGFSEELLAVSYPEREKSVLIDRLEWARSYCKLGGVLESPRRGLYLLTPEGQEVLALPEEEARERLRELNRVVRRSRQRDRAESELGSETPTGRVGDDEADTRWRDELLSRLHRLSPDAFERFSLYLLRLQGMELQRVGGVGDQGIDGIGTAPLTAVLSTTVAVQAKRYDPAKSIGREVVALFQSDSIAAGAEHGVLITTARFTSGAKNAALGRSPTIDLIDGVRLAELCLAEGIGIDLEPVVDVDWFDRFEG